MTSMTGIAIKKGIVDLRIHQLRDYTKNRQKQTEDLPPLYKAKGYRKSGKFLR